MVGHGVRSCEDGARFSVHSLTVAKEETFARRVVLVEDTALPNKALVYQGRVAYFNTRSNNEIGTFDAATQANRSRFIRIESTVFQTTHAVQFRIIADADILYTAAVQDSYMIADKAVVRSLRLRVRIYLPLQLMNHRRTMTIKRQNIRQTGAQFVENRYLATTAFVHHLYAYAVAERGTAIH